MQRIRVQLSSAQRAELWRRWKTGQSLHEIGRAFGKSHVVIHFLLARHGGIAPAARRRSLRTLTLAEREDISRGIAGGSSLRQIAKGLERAVSTPLGSFILFSTVARVPSFEGGGIYYLPLGTSTQPISS